MADYTDNPPRGAAESSARMNRRAELRAAAFKREGGLSAWYRRGILDSLDALDAVEQQRDRLVSIAAQLLHAAYDDDPQRMSDALRHGAIAVKAAVDGLRAERPAGDR